ncbi:sulfite exporter TauE/SafE family protein, partial [Actinomadura adrarensis]
RREYQHPHGGPWLWAGVLLAGVYGGYFGAAQGIILIALLGIALDDDLQRLNATKNVLSAIVNGTAALLFIVLSWIGDNMIDWMAVLLVAIGATIGGLLGARVGRKIPPMVLRGVIVVVGLVALANLLL